MPGVVNGLLDDLLIAHHGYIDQMVQQLEGFPLLLVQQLDSSARRRHLSADHWP